MVYMHNMLGSCASVVCGAQYICMFVASFDHHGFCPSGILWVLVYTPLPPSAPLGVSSAA